MRYGKMHILSQSLFGEIPLVYESSSSISTIPRCDLTLGS
jgi:hypothetical protein